ncbi:10724_t:CDS:2 [Acaulospora morrowiae]|uniref:10724_t:CDS:1 n=1 Tax=Acaulospora morrowiae TaxID=94023 RepID=A0A9N8WK56_9GLOM|nr:10724_t:CDS:2 [Acaulospora morrowiae]
MSVKFSKGGFFSERLIRKRDVSGEFLWKGGRKTDEVEERLSSVKKNGNETEDDCNLLNLRMIDS